MTTVRALLCDDEPLALARMAQLLSRFPDVETVAQAPDGQTALRLIAELAPDVVFLDVEMPLIDGFDVVEELGRDLPAGAAPPIIVFITAHAGAAASAFETGATDFLTKPVRLSRLDLALGRVRRAIEDRSARTRLEELISQLAELRHGRGAADQGGRIWVRRRGETVGVILDAVDRISAEREYIRLYQGDRTYLHRASLTSVLPMLDAQRFLRVHRSHVLARSSITAVRRTPSGDLRVVTTDGEVIPVGRSYRFTLRSLTTPAG